MKRTLLSKVFVVLALSGCILGGYKCLNSSNSPANPQDFINIRRKITPSEGFTLVDSNNNTYPFVLSNSKYQAEVDLEIDDTFRVYDSGSNFVSNDSDGKYYKNGCIAYIGSSNTFKCLVGGKYTFTLSQWGVLASAAILKMRHYLSLTDEIALGYEVPKFARTTTYLTVAKETDPEDILLTSSFAGPSTLDLKMANQKGPSVTADEYKTNFVAKVYTGSIDPANLLLTETYSINDYLSLAIKNNDDSAKAIKNFATALDETLNDKTVTVTGHTAKETICTSLDKLSTEGDNYTPVRKFYIEGLTSYFDEASLEIDTKVHLKYKYTLPSGYMALYNGEEIARNETGKSLNLSYKSEGIAYSRLAYINKLDVIEISSNQIMGRLGYNVYQYIYASLSTSSDTNEIKLLCSLYDLGVQSYLLTQD